MKVLMINIDKSVFAPNSPSLERLREYSNFCDKMSVIVLTQKYFEPIILGNLAIFATVSSCRIKYSFDALKLIGEIMKKEKYDLVVTQDPFDTGHIGWLVKKKYKIPWQCQIHGDFLSPYFWRESLANKIRVLLSKFLLPRADGVRVVSQRIKKSLLAKNYKLKSEPVVLPISVDIEKWELAEVRVDLKKKYPQFDFLILMASRLSQEKNISLAIKAMAEVSREYAKVGLIIVGDGEEKNKLKKLVKNKNLQPNIIFEEWSSDLVSYFKTADLFLLTSNYEGWGMTVIEAASCGCPIVMTDVGCAGEVIKNGESGIIIKIGDKSALTAAIMKLIKDKNFGREISHKAKDAVSFLPNWERSLDIYKNSLTNLLR